MSVEYVADFEQFGYGNQRTIYTMTKNPNRL